MFGDDVFRSLREWLDKLKQLMKTLEELEKPLLNGNRLLKTVGVDKSCEETATDSQSE